MTASVTRSPTTFAIEGVPACGFVHTSDAAVRDVGVVIVVGGPQTRVGSHRAFFYLADALARAGYPTLRFDTRGMGDSHGAFPGFEHLQPDLHAAVAQLMHCQPTVQRVVLWALCDGASAAMISASQLHPAVEGFVFANPWVHQPEGAGAAVAAKVQMKHYYAQKLTDLGFWRRLFSGKINPFRAGAELAGTAKAATARSDAMPSSATNYVEAMRIGWSESHQPALVITAGQDLVAQEWLACQVSTAWATPRKAPTQTRHFEAANHTFSTAAWRAQVEACTIAWIQETFQAAK
jgi:uncharacterized protein